MIRMDCRYVTLKWPCNCVSVKIMPDTTLSVSGSPMELSFVKNYLKKSTCHDLIFGCCIIFQAFWFCTRLKTLEKHVERSKTSMFSLNCWHRKLAIFLLKYSMAVPLKVWLARCIWKHGLRQKHNRHHSTCIKSFGLCDDVYPLKNIRRKKK